MSDQIRIMEVGPRDGLQAQQRNVPINIRKQFIQLLINAGVKRLEAGSLVNPELVPQMAHSEDIIKGMNFSGVEPFFLVPNEKGLERALKVGIKNIAVFTACTDGFAKKNIGLSMEQSKKELKALVPKAKAIGFKVRGYVSVVWGCPYDGLPKKEDIFSMVDSLLQMGCFEVSLGDTIGVADPKGVLDLIREMAQKFPLEKLAVHFHDTRGMALTNTYVAMAEGIRSLDSSAGGLGGCPFAPGAAGSLGTEDLLFLAKSLGFETGIDMEKLTKASKYIYEQLAIPHYVSKTLQAYLVKKWD